MKRFVLFILAVYISFFANAQTRLLSIVSQDWNAQNNTWLNTWHENRIYDDGGRYLGRINEKFLQNEKKWIHWNKFENEFDEKTGYISQVNGYGYIDDEHPFVQGKTQYIYDEYNRYQQSIDYSIDAKTQGSNPLGKGFNLYDAKNRIIVNTGYKYDLKKNDFSAQTRTEYFYNDNNKYACYITYEWNNSINNWEYKTKMIYTYTAFGEVQTTLLQTFNKANKGWENKTLNTQEYNESKQLIMSYEQTWNSDKKDWQWTQKTAQSYYNDGFTQQLTLYLFDNNTGKWNLKSRSVFYYEFTPKLAKPISKFDFEVYPNPSQGVVHIKSAESSSIKEIFIYNTSGQRVLYSNSTENLDLSSFQNGTYFINAVSKNNETVVKKINLIH